MAEASISPRDLPRNSPQRGLLAIVVGPIILCLAGCWRESAEPLGSPMTDDQREQTNPTAKDAADKNTSPEEPAAFDQLWDFSNPSGTEAKFRELLSSDDAKRDSYRLQLLTQIARCQGLERKFRGAHQTLDEVRGGLAQVPPVVRVRYLLERGRVYNSSNQADKARPSFLSAWELACESGEDHFAIDAAHMLGVVETADKAMRWNEKALARAEGSKDERARKWLGSLYNNIGWTHHDEGRFDKALAMFEKAQAWREEQKQPAEAFIAKWSVARAKRSLGQIKEALALQEALLREYEAAGTKDGYVFEELGECHLALDQPKKAAGFFAEAYAELSKDPWLVENETKRVERIKRLGGVE